MAMTIERFFEYEDPDGKRWGHVQRVANPSARANIDTTLLDADKHLSHQARVFGWKKVKVYSPSLTQAEIMRKTNEIRQSNGEEPLYDDEAIALASKDVETVITRVNEDGTHQPVTTKVLATGEVRAMVQPILGAPVTPGAPLEHVPPAPPASSAPASSAPATTPA